MNPNSPEKASLCPPKNIFLFLFPVQLLNEEWCWKEKHLDLEIIDKAVGGLDFFQSGYILSCSLSHDITLVSHCQGKRYE